MGKATCTAIILGNRRQLWTSNTRSGEAVKVSAYFLRQSDPRLSDDADDEGDEIYDEAVD